MAHLHEFQFYDPFLDHNSNLPSEPSSLLTEPERFHARPVELIEQAILKHFNNTMATETAALPVNGMYHGPAAEDHSFAEVNRLGDAAGAVQSASVQQPQDHSKDEVAWYFAEKYYTTMSKNPEQLHLFFNKRSQFVFGVEAEKEPVYSGQKAIKDRVKELGFHDCKVRVTNVDSQVSGDNIIIQVIGAMSNNYEPSRKFVQTFVLAAQSNGYFVLNDIFRYLYDEEEEEAAPEEETEEVTEVTAVPAGYQEPVPTVEDSEPKTLTSSTDLAEREHDAALVDKELEEVIREEETTKEPTPTAAVNGTPDIEEADVAHTEEAPAAAVAAPEPTEDVPEPEKPQDPVPSPVVPLKEPPKATAPAKPAVPRTWAQAVGGSSRAAAAAAPVPAVTTSAPSQPKQSQSQQAQAPAPPATAASPTTPVREPSPGDGSQEGSSGGWQAVGTDHRRQQSRSQGQPTGDNDKVRAYVRNVYSDISTEDLKNTLSKFGTIAYCDINRQKNSAFVEFSTRAGFQAAVAANPHRIGNHEIYVEERRVNAFPGNRGNVRGNRNSFDGRTAGQGRGGAVNTNRDTSRGGFAPRGRGSSATPRGRGTATA